MPRRIHASLILIVLLTFLPGAVSSQFPINPNRFSVKIFEILDFEGTRLGTVVIAGRSNRGYRTGNKYWRFDTGQHR